MGRISKTTTSRPNLRLHYQKLVDEYSSNLDSFERMPTIPEYLSYCCHHCGHTQKLQVINYTIHVFALILCSFMKKVPLDLNVNQLKTNHFTS